ncbi:hypothetical protein QTP88_007436 [Uroleucon formosanum]
MDGGEELIRRDRVGDGGVAGLRAAAAAMNRRRKVIGLVGELLYGGVGRVVTSLCSDAKTRLALLTPSLVYNN